MTWTLNEIAVMRLELPGVGVGEITLRITEVEAGVVCGTPAMTEERQADASAFLKIFGDSMARVKYCFNPDSGEPLTKSVFRIKLLKA